MRKSRTLSDIATVMLGTKGLQTRVFRDLLL